MMADEIKSLACRYVASDIEISGTKQGLLALARFLSGNTSSEVLLVNSDATEFYPNFAQKIVLVETESKLRLFCAEEVFFIEGHRKYREVVAKSIAFLVNGATARSGSHMHFEPEVDDYVDEQSWTLVVSIE